jgi:hypothetical protein
MTLRRPAIHVERAPFTLLVCSEGGSAATAARCESQNWRPTAFAEYHGMVMDRPDCCFCDKTWSWSVHVLPSACRVAPNSLDGRPPVLVTQMSKRPNRCSRSTKRKTPAVSPHVDRRPDCLVAAKGSNARRRILKVKSGGSRASCSAKARPGGPLLIVRTIAGRPATDPSKPSVQNFYILPELCCTSNCESRR